jgi:outer membrane protein assembly factor BamE
MILAGSLVSALSYSVLALSLNQLRIDMPTLLSPPRLPVLLAAGLLASALLTGCASKNPLLDGAPSQAAATTNPAPATAATSVQAASAADANSGLKRTTPNGVRRFFGIFAPYRVDIPQGNFVSEEMLAQLKEGMSPDQVRFVLGTPLVTDVFHAERWDYVFRMLKTNDEVLSSRVTVFFKDGKMSRFEGGNLPNEVDYLALIAGAVPKKSTSEVSPIKAVPLSAVKPNQ